MSDDDEFRRIAAREFGEDWHPPTDAGVTPSPAEPANDFHLNLYDDDESYRQVDPATWHTGTLARAGLAAIALGLILVVLRVLGQVAGWSAWASAIAVMAGLGLIIAQAIGRHHGDGDDGTAV